MPQKGTYIKAFVLLVVFSMNTVVSFACSLGGFFHSLHHHTSEEKNVTGHHRHKGDHQQGHESTSHYHHDETSNKKEDDCCSKNVVQVEKVEKAVSRAIEAPDAIFLASFLSACSSLFSLFPTEEKTFYPDNIRWRLPATIQDLRIVIQSFQI